MPLTPKNRKEEWLQGLVDHETTLTPKNRKEEWMKEIIDASGGGGGGGDIDLGITGASVGEYAKIKTVDADGVPTAWESGSGGGGGIPVIDASNSSITIDGVDYDKITLSTHMKDMSFILVDPSIIAAEPPFLVIDVDADDAYMSSLMVFKPFITQPMSEGDVDIGIDNVYSPSSITVIAVIWEGQVDPIVLIPNNATYEAN